MRATHGSAWGEKKKLERKRKKRLPEMFSFAVAICLLGSGHRGLAGQCIFSIRAPSHFPHQIEIMKNKMGRRPNR